MKAKDVALGVLVSVLWAFNFVVIQVGLDDFPPFLFAALRFSCAGVPALFLIRPGIPWRLVLTVGAVLGLGYFSLLFLGMKLGMPAGLSSLVAQSQAAFTAILSAAFLGQPPTARQGLGTAAALAGIVLIAWDTSGQASFAGLLLVLAASFNWAVGNVIIRRSGCRDPFRLMLLSGLVPPLPNLGLSLWLETGQAEALASLTLAGVGAVLYTGLVSTSIAWSLWALLLRRYPASAVAPFSILVPLFGMGLAWLLLGEPFGMLKAAASVLMLGGVAATVLSDEMAGRLLPFRPWTALADRRAG